MKNIIGNIEHCYDPKDNKVKLWFRSDQGFIYTCDFKVAEINESIDLKFNNIKAPEINAKPKKKHI